ncbi:hypothetical protein CYMTET_4476 [Cymbomonas tetramitiformis]|uniref:Chromo domain-containing protein n=1 Tax=Cymbomonas tetramitiformis TaxID=36881 RepID=A0AAE0LKB9_9CHLO|nr:hypothetical protein CYMTET_4476 [Cymbomonas tetramitiformis]
MWLIGWEGFPDRDDTWEPIEHLAGYEGEIRAFRERKKEEDDKKAAEAGANKKRRKEEEDARLVEDDCFEDTQGGNRRSPVWKYFKIQKCEGKVQNVRCTLCSIEKKPIAYCGNITNIRVHLTSCHKDEYCKLIAANTTSETASTESQSKLDELVPQISSEKRDELHRLITKWLVRCGRPLTLPQHDEEFRDIFRCLTKGQYVPPTYHIVIEQVLKLSVEGKARVVQQLKELLEEGILPSICGDIWSQGGISIFGILVYWVDKNFEFQSRLLAAIPVLSVRHTGVELENATKVACADFGLGQYCGQGVDGVDTVPEFIHATCSDNASNIVCGWESFDGHECSAHTLALVVLTFLEQPLVRKVAVQMYDVESPTKAANAVPNPDGSVYRNHQLMLDEWDIVRESVYILRLMDCKLEDFVVATMLDPRYKSFKFKYAGRWMRGRLTLKQAETWLANAFEADWKPKGPVEEDERPAKKMKSGPTERTSVASFLMCDSDEEDAVEDAAAEECEVEELDEVHRSRACL